MAAEQILDAHRELDREVWRLTAEYQQAVQAAMLAYSNGIAAAQSRFQERLMGVQTQKES